MKSQTLKLKVAALPKYARRRVVWHETDISYQGHKQIEVPKPPDAVTGHIMVLVGYCPDTLPYFIRMVQELQKAVPELKTEEVTCGKVVTSATVKGYTLVIAPIAGPKRVIPGFDEWHSIDFGY